MKEIKPAILFFSQKAILTEFRPEKLSGRDQ